MNLNTPALLAISCAVYAALTVLPAQAQSRPASASYAIAAGPLSTALNDFAVAANVSLSTDPAQTRGLQSPGVRGAYSVAQGFALLLAGSGLEAVQLPNGGVCAAPGGHRAAAGRRENHGAGEPSAPAWNATPSANTAIRMRRAPSPSARACRPCAKFRSRSASSRARRWTTRT